MICKSEAFMDQKLYTQSFGFSKAFTLNKKSAWELTKLIPINHIRPTQLYYKNGNTFTSTNLKRSRKSLGKYTIYRNLNI